MKQDEFKKQELLSLTPCFSGVCGQPREPSTVFNGFWDLKLTPTNP